MIALSDEDFVGCVNEGLEAIEAKFRVAVDENSNLIKVPIGYPEQTKAIARAKQEAIDEARAIVEGEFVALSNRITQLAKRVTFLEKDFNDNDHVTQKRIRALEVASEPVDKQRTKWPGQIIGQPASSTGSVSATIGGVDQSKL